MNYILTITLTGTQLKLTYTGHFLKKINIVKGRLEGLQLRHLGEILPPLESLISEWQGRWAGKIIYKKEERSLNDRTSLYRQFLDEWFSFYERQFGLKPKHTGAEGLHLKQIIQYFSEISGDEKEAFSLWQVLLGNWQKLDAFHQKNADLKYINSQLNKLIQNVKRGHQTGNASVSDAFKREILAGLFT